MRPHRPLIVLWPLLHCLLYFQSAAGLPPIGGVARGVVQSLEAASFHGSAQGAASFHSDNLHLTSAAAPLQETAPSQRLPRPALDHGVESLRADHDYRPDSYHAALSSGGAPSQKPTHAEQYLDDDEFDRLLEQFFAEDEYPVAAVDAGHSGPSASNAGEDLSSTDVQDSSPDLSSSPPRRSPDFMPTRQGARLAAPAIKTRRSRLTYRYGNEAMFEAIKVELLDRLRRYAGVSPHSLDEYVLSQAAVRPADTRAIQRRLYDWYTLPVSDLSKSRLLKDIEWSGPALGWPNGARYTISFHPKYRQTPYIQAPPSFPFRVFRAVAKPHDGARREIVYVGDFSLPAQLLLD
ncbi:uncharacterized protein PFL1_00013 [Pseudozyma flocculosa PF-1]|uniref:SUN domain-containing protein n=1 Tax=Pseudozyma flocculosa TaxID=84751 RepID=A0A5C3ETC3_9BASI|nr:uncharacterized protein PFL1_00013 [Pseudozyma flocculosa PF-1]EPQ31814.1 hypothetical protein PFL1_00013 [Pseudozyma flocculosa PF-1]SPO35292.1 uncharacterized protein PSFLO_00763 [Pseudozyma flocculosa]